MKAEPTSIILPRTDTGRLQSLRSFQEPFVRQVALRRLALMLIDGSLIIACVVGAIALRLKDQDLLINTLNSQSQLVPLAVISGLPFLYLSGWYKGLTRYAGSYSLYGLLPRSTVMVLVLLLANTLVGGGQPPRSFWILYWILFTAAAIGSRIVLRDVLLLKLSSRTDKSEETENKATLIYGAGSSGVSLLMALRNDPRFRIAAFLDDDPSLHGRTLHNLPIRSPAQLPTLIERQGIRQVLLALPTLSRARKRQLVDQLGHLGLTVLSIPSLAQLATGQRLVSDLQAVAIEDLLGREPSSPEPALLGRSVEGKNVLVTGAGGSIGSELCRQIQALGANTLVLMERNEFSLYSIESELRRSSQSKSSKGTIQVHPVLGDSGDSQHLTRICKKFNIQTIFHAAAYKHVPMVEANLCAGVANNLYSTKAVIAASIDSKVESVTLISTDKAVRPTNAMGASKRICELLIQEAAQSPSCDKPIFSMVRFGNVLGSSGSVIPLFHQQIARGGPVTVTHPAITRYFMTIPEAVALVLQSAGMAKGGELFLLDMGEPVRIADLARQMIELSGLRVRDTQNPDGDISIHYTGLRPGEKLYEELLISNEDEPTAHPLIRKANEPRPANKDFPILITALEDALQRWDETASSDLLKQLVPEYKPEKLRQLV